jgi:uncharacterized protein (DUF924 family)
MTAAPITPDDILKFWFEEAGPSHWYKVSDEFDALMRNRFASAIEAEAVRAADEDHPWLEDPDQALALIILFDQFPRNIWRGSGQAFAFDSLARRAAETMISIGFDRAVAEDRRAFVYMPFMHSESLDDQDLCVALADERLAARGTHDHAVKHREVIRQFGRFPYRNDALGRETSDAEREYLETGGYAPGRNDSAKKT